MSPLGILSRDLERWMLEVPPEVGVVSSRLRLARNLQEPFPGLLGMEERRAMRDRTFKVIAGLASFQEALFLELEGLPAHQRIYLMERGLISRSAVSAPEGRGLVVCSEGRLSVVVGEEDHLRIQCLSPGLDLEGGFACADSLETELEEVFDFAFSEEFGYLTACPGNAGTGMRASVLIHLPALALGEDLDRILRALGVLDLAVRSAFGESREAPGGFIQVANARCLGLPEQDIIAKLDEAARKLLLFEEKARLRALGEAQSLLDDQVVRALEQLRSARPIGGADAISLLGTLRMGNLAGLIEKPTLETIQKALALSQPGHLQMMEGCSLEDGVRKERRAELILRLLASEAAL